MIDKDTDVLYTMHLLTKERVMYEVDQVVGVIRYGTWGDVSHQGLYRVTKSNKVRTHLKRLTDGYEREFSAKTGIEKGSERYRSAQIVTEEKYRQFEADKIERTRISNCWDSIENAAHKRNLIELKEMIAKLESL